jgi:hypothetical protein
MARKFLTALDLGKNELQNAKVQNLATDPASPVLGQIYYNTVSNEMRIYNGTIFEAIGLNGVTADAAEINILDGATLTTTELNYVDGVTSAIQTQIDTKSPSANPTFTGTVTLDTGVNIVFEGATANAFEATLTAGDPTADRTITLPDSTTTLVGTDTTDTLTNKTLTSPTVTSPTVSGLYLSDGSVVFEGATANAFETTLQVTDPTADRTITLPDATDTLVGRDTTDTLTNKTLTSPTISGLTLSDSSIVVEGATADAYETTLSFVDPTADRTIYVPNADGTLARVENKLHDFAVATASVDLNSQKITNLATPTTATDAANKGYVDAAVVGIDWKASVRVATTAAVTLATAFENGDTLDGVTLATGNRVLVKDQADGAENGIYTVNASGAPTRATDADTAAEVTASFAVFVEEGTVNADSAWTLTNNGTVTIGTTALVFTQFTGLGQITAGAGLTKAANTLDVGAGTGITVNANDVAIDTAVVVRKYAVSLGDGSATSYTITHNLGTRDVTVALYEVASPYAEVLADVEHTTTNTITVKFTLAPTTDQFRVVVHG